MRAAVLVLTGALAWAALPAAAGEKTGEVKVEGYAEWQAGGLLVVDGQRLVLARGARFKGRGEAADFASIPLGYEVKAKGQRRRDGVVEARELEARPNDEDALFEKDLREAFDEIEDQYVQARRVWEEDEEGHEEEIGRLRARGPEVERVRAIVSDLVPPYRDQEDFRVYVIDNEEWNAMAAPNGAIFVFSGLLEALDDDELAVILGHELVHATHEHSRKQYKKDMIVQLIAAGVIGAAEEIDSEAKKILVQGAALMAAMAWQSGYGRSHEDQADRVGLRYAWEAGYDVGKAPRLWQRFADKYGNGNRVVNFFFADHSASQDRARKLAAEIDVNYPEAARARRGHGQL